MMPDILAASEGSFGKGHYPPAEIIHFVPTIRTLAVLWENRWVVAACREVF